MSFVNIDEFLTSHLKFSLVKWRESCSLYLLKKILIKMAVPRFAFCLGKSETQLRGGMGLKGPVTKPKHRSAKALQIGWLSWAVWQCRRASPQWLNWPRDCAYAQLSPQRDVAGRTSRNLTDLLRALFELCKNEADWLRAHETSVLIRPRVTPSSLASQPTAGQAGFLFSHFNHLPRGVQSGLTCISVLRRFYLPFHFCLLKRHYW